MKYDLLQTGEGDGGVLVIKHRHLEAGLPMRRLGAEIHSSELLTLMLETRGGGQGQVLDTVHHLGHLIFRHIFLSYFFERDFIVT